MPSPGFQNREMILCPKAGILTAADRARTRDPPFEELILICGTCWPLEVCRPLEKESFELTSFEILSLSSVDHSSSGRHAPQTTRRSWNGGSCERALFSSASGGIVRGLLDKIWKSRFRGLLSYSTGSREENRFWKIRQPSQDTPQHMQMWPI